MKLAEYIKNNALEGNERLLALEKKLAGAGNILYKIYSPGDLEPDTDMLLSVGGDGTFLSASKRAGDTEIPVLGVNLGRLGFLSENAPEDVAKAILSGKYEIENRSLLKVEMPFEKEIYPYALNEVCLHRQGASILGIDLSIDGHMLPQFYADGILVATSSGSTAYSLSVGGPICTPEAKVFIVSPVAPHNLNVRPIVVPDSSNISISLVSRDPNVMLSIDNRSIPVPKDTTFTISMAQFSLKRVRLPRSGFVKALTEKLFWGEDKRNGNGQ